MKRKYLVASIIVPIALLLIGATQVARTYIQSEAFQTDSGVMAFRAVGGTNNEDVEIDLETTPNEIDITSTTGVLAIELNDIKLKAKVLESTVALGTAPFVVASNTKVANLNADNLDGIDSTGFQGVDTTLNALAAYNTNGLITQTAADTFTGRTIAGTANKIGVSNGDGISGNPTITIPDGVVLVGPLLGTPASGVATNLTGLPLDTGVTGNLAVANGGTGRPTSTTAYGLIAAGTTATGAHQTLAAGATTELLVGGGVAALPVWTTATGTGAPVRAGSPTFNTQITSPKILGGTGTTQAITYQTTSGVGAAGARHIFLVGNNGATEAATILNSGFVGIGTDSPASLLHVTSGTTATGITTLGQASADTDAPDLNIRKSRGTVASPTVITTGDELGVVNFQGYSGAGGYVTGAAIKGHSTGTVATTRVPGVLSFWTGTDAAPTVLTERMRVTEAGNVGIGDTSPAALLTVGNGDLFQVNSSGHITQAPSSTNDAKWVPATITTTNATVTTLQTIAITASNTYFIEARVTARRTGGAAGAADDGAAYRLVAMVTTKSGTVTIDGLSIDPAIEDQAAWACTLTVSGSNVLVQVTGAASNNVSWFADTYIQRTAS